MTDVMKDAPAADGAGADAGPADAAAGDGARWLRRIGYVAIAGLFFGLPFALQAGSEFFLPVTGALVIAVALVPALEWLERRRVPSSLAAFTCVLTFLIVVNGALALIIVPAGDWFARLPERMPRILATLAPLIDFYSNLSGFIDQALRSVASNTAAQAQQVAIQTPNSLLDYLTTAAPAAAIQMLFAILLIYFLLSGWSRLRERMIRSRSSFEGALSTARLIQSVIDSTAAYLGTIMFINTVLGLLTALFLWMIGMPSPIMWGGIVTLCNFVPYVGPIVAAGLLGLGGLMTFDSVSLALLPAFIQIGLHVVEANLVTPLVLGRRLTISPMLILISLSYWGWIWGAPGAFLAVPILIIIQTVVLSLRGSRPEWAPPAATNATSDEEKAVPAG